MKVTVQRSNRKTIGIEINTDMSVTVKAPLYLSDKDIDKILLEKEAWIRRTRDRMRSAQEQLGAQRSETLSQAELKELAKKAVKHIPDRVEYFSQRIGVTYGRITIRAQKTRWGSCSSKGNLNFNCLLMLTPPEVIDYVVVHELCHRKHMNHSKLFWDEVERILPDYKKQKKYLKDNGKFIMAKIY